jgi:hypothetical protein
MRQPLFLFSPGTEKKYFLPEIATRTSSLRCILWEQISEDLELCKGLCRCAEGCYTTYNGCVLASFYVDTVSHEEGNIPNFSREYFTLEYTYTVGWCICMQQAMRERGCLSVPGLFNVLALSSSCPVFG